MPYSCSVAGGKPVLARSADRGHRIIGRREQRRFTACSPTRRAHCRRWTIHRFNVDCGGTTIPWMSVVAASDKKRRAWVDGDTFAIRMPRSWTMDPNDPCARFHRFDERRRYGPRERYCAERRANAPRPLVRMPPGFAPTFGIDAIFVQDKSGRDAVASVENSDDIEQGTRLNETPVITPPPPGQHRKEPRPSLPASEPAADKGEPKVTQPEETKLAASQEESPSDSEGATPVTVINATDQEATATTAKTAIDTSGPAQTGAQTKGEIKLVDVGAGLQQSTQTPTADAKTETGSIGQTNTAELHKKNSPNPLPYLLAGLAAAGLLVLAGWMMSRRQFPTPKPATVRDIASVTLTGNKNAKTSRSRDVVIAKPKAVSAPRQYEPEKIKRPQPPSTTIGDAIPKSREEAFAILGMSVKPDASEVAIKKIVDGLRLSWHPDHAKDAADRQTRELRTKQINAAWEILSEAKAKNQAPNKSIAPPETAA